MQKYVHIAKISFINEAIYPSRLFGNIFKDSLLLIIYLFLWKTLYGDRNEVLGYTLNGIITYYALSFTIRALVNSRSASRAVEDDVKSGNLSTFLLQPISYTLLNFTSLTIYNFVRILIPASMVVLLTYIYPVFDPPTNIVLFIPSFGLAIVISFLYHSIFGAISFWLVNTWGIRSFMGRIVSLLSGSVVPLSFFPMWLQQINAYLPFESMVSIPVNIYLGNLHSSGFSTLIGKQVLWVALLVVLHKVVWKRGYRKYDSVGI